MKDAEGCKMSTYLSLEHFCYFRVLCFCRSNRMQGRFMKLLVFSFKLMVVSTRSWSLPMSASGKDFFFFFLLCWYWTLNVGMSGWSILLWSAHKRHARLLSLTICGMGSVGKGESMAMLRTQWVSIRCRLSLQDPTAQVSSYQRQQWNQSDGKHSCS